MGAARLDRRVAARERARSLTCTRFNAALRLLAGLFVLTPGCRASTSGAVQPSSAATPSSFTEPGPRHIASLADIQDWLEDFDFIGGERASGSALSQEGVHHLLLGEHEVATIEGEGEACPDRLGTPLVEFVGVESFALTIDTRVGMTVATLRSDEARCWPLLAAAPHDYATPVRVRLPDPNISANLELRGDHEGVEQIDRLAGGVQVSSASGEVLLAWQPRGCFVHNPIAELEFVQTEPSGPFDPCGDDSPELVVHAATQGLLLVLRFDCADGRSEAYAYWWPWVGPAYESYCELDIESEVETTSDDIREIDREMLYGRRDRWPLGPLVLVLESIGLEREREFTMLEDLDADGEGPSYTDYWGERLERWTIPVGSGTVTRLVAHDTPD